jgi:hypothetical protein
VQIVNDELHVSATAIGPAANLVTQLAGIEE